MPSLTAVRLTRPCGSYYPSSTGNRLGTKIPSCPFRGAGVCREYRYRALRLALAHRALRSARLLRKV